MIGKRHLVRIARAVLGAFLLLQAALAIAACQSGGRAPAEAVRFAAGTNMPDCQESMAPSPDAGLCLGHCMAGLQALEKPAASVAALPAAAVFFVLPSYAPPAVAAPAPPPHAGPPPRIRFQSLLI